MRFRSDPISKTKQCSCGAQAKLIKRRNFPFGRNSVARTSMSYKCNSCNIENPMVRPAAFRR